MQSDEIKSQSQSESSEQLLSGSENISSRDNLSSSAKKYSVIPDDIRHDFIVKVTENKLTIKKVSLILKTFGTEGVLNF